MLNQVDEEEEDFFVIGGIYDLKALSSTNANSPGRVTVLRRCGNEIFIVLTEDGTIMTWGLLRDHRKRVF